MFHVKRTTDPVKQRHWAKVQQGKELAALRREARIIHPNGTQKVKAKYKQVAMRTPWQTEMDFKK
jgi:hypothetical protein